MIPNHLKPDPATIRQGDQIAYWFFKPNWRIAYKFGTVLEKGTIDIADERLIWFSIAEEKNLAILGCQVELVINRRKKL